VAGKTPQLDGGRRYAVSQRSDEVTVRRKAAASLDLDAAEKIARLSVF